MSHCVLHYACDTSDAYKISCGRLTQAFADRLREMYPPPPLAHQPAGWRGALGWRVAPTEGGAPGGEPGGAPGGEPGGAPGALGEPRLRPGDPALLFDPGLWESAAELQWSLASDRAIRAPELARTLGRLRASGKFEVVSRSCASLAAALVAAHPLLQDEHPSTLLQLVALGSDMALAAAQDSELLRYVKNELQTVDLASAFGGL